MAATPVIANMRTLPSCAREAAVQAALESAVQLDDARVVERQQLRENRARYFPHGVDPVVAVEQPRPAVAAGAAAIGPGPRVDVEGQAPFLLHAREQVGGVGPGWCRRLQRVIGLAGIRRGRAALLGAAAQEASVRHPQGLEDVLPEIDL